MKKLCKNPIFLTSSLVLIITVFAAIFAPFLTTFSFEEQNVSMRLLTPNSTYFMGTDALGRDLFSRILYGARVSVMVGVVTAFASLLIGTFIGSLAGYFGGWVDLILMRVVDVFYTFPSMLLAILVMVVVGQGISGILIALALTSWVHPARLVRGQVLQIKEHLHVESARALGANDFQIVVKHILPLLLGPLIVSLTYQIPSNIMAESFLSFIGLGIQPPFASWGTLAADGFRGMRSYPHLILFPGGVLFITMMAFQFFGDALRDFLDPREGPNPDW